MTESLTIVIVVPADALDLHTASNVISNAEQHALTSDAQSVVLDLSQVEFIDAAGIGAIVGLNNRLNANGDGTVRLTAASHTVRRVFTLTRLTSLLT